jgi:hypothetical protein
MLGGDFFIFEKVDTFKFEYIFFSNPWTDVAKFGDIGMA